jgi:tetratricopeptide (TPR) repeat protein
VGTATVPVAAAVASSAAGAPPEHVMAGVVSASADDPAAASSAPLAITPGVVVAAPSTDASVLRVRPLTESNVMDLAGGDWSDARARAGWEAYQRGDLESARTALTPIAIQPIAPSWVRYVLGQADYALGKFREAVDAWERVRARQPRFEPVYLDLADGYVKLNERRKSIDVLRAARQRWPKDPDLFNALGVIEAGGGDVNAAIKTFREGVVAVPNDAMMHLNLAKALEMTYMKKRSNSKLLGWRMGQADGELYQDALKEYRAYLASNGPYADVAREGLDRLGAAAPNIRPR